MASGSIYKTNDRVDLPVDPVNDTLRVDITGTWVGTLGIYKYVGSTIEPWTWSLAGTVSGKATGNGTYYVTVPKGALQFAVLGNSMVSGFAAIVSTDYNTGAYDPKDINAGHMYP